jgi:ribosome modulation factor
MSDLALVMLGIVAATMLAMALHGETVRRIAKRERKDAYEKGYYQGYTDHVLGRSRNKYRSASDEDRNENQNKAPGEKQLPEGQIER